MSREYLNYLIRKRAVVLGFFAMCCLGISIAWAAGGLADTAMLRGSETAAALTMLMAIGFPLVQFSYVHRRSSADRFFALPVSREKQLVTEIAFLFGSCAVCYLVIMCILYAMYGIGHMAAGQFLLILAAVLLSLLEAVLISSCLYLIANSVFDGIMICAAYTFLPLTAAVTVTTFHGSLVAGDHGYSSGLSYLLSPAALAFRFITSVHNGEPVSVPEVLLGIAYALLACFGLYRNYAERKTERAEQLSDSLFAYPVIINIYAAATLFCLACDTVSHRPDFILYLILFVVYIIAQFVYKRKIELKPVYLAVFAGLLAVTHITAYAGWKTHGFGEAERLPLPTENIRTYDYYAYVTPEDLGKADPEYRVCVRVMINIPRGKEASYREAIDILEAYRKKAIDWYYERSADSTGDTGRLNVYGKQAENSYDMTGHLWYGVKEPIPEKDLIRLSEYGSVQVESPVLEESYSLSQYIEKRR
ncbi:MAG: hypothetical protein IKG46_05270 [Solobacterium sp.]|nr:hypothetical protein [Solobacterium sp.]